MPNLSELKTPQSRAELRLIAILGEGQVAHLVACLLARVLPATRVVIVRDEEQKCQHGLADKAHIAPPALTALHERLGIDETMLFSRIAASHQLATIFQDWGERADGWSFGYGGSLHCAQSLREIHSVSARLAVAGKFHPPSPEPSSIFYELDYALRFAPSKYLRCLKAAARQLNIGTGSSKDTLFEADLIIDTLPPNKAARSGWVGWLDILPIRMIGWSGTPPELATGDFVCPVDDGYVIRSPGRDVTRHIHCAFGSANFDTQFQPEHVISVLPGRVEAAWTEKTIRIGDAAAEFEPLLGLHLLLVAKQIELLLALTPGRDFEAAERSEFNRRASLLADHVRDALAACYVPPSDAECTKSTALRQRIADFQRRGLLRQFEDDPISSAQWYQLLSASGKPGLQPRLAALDTKAAAQNMKLREQTLKAAVESAPSYKSWFARNIGQSL